MTEQVQVQENTYLAMVLAEVAADGVGPAVLKDAVAAKLGALWDSASASNDQQALALVTDAWNKVEILTFQANGALHLAAAAREALATTTAARDQANALLEKKEEELSLWREEGVDAALEMISYSGAYISTDPGFDISEVLGVSYEEGTVFYQALLDMDYDVGEVLRAELAAFVKDFAARVLAWQDEEDGGGEGDDDTE